MNLLEASTTPFSYFLADTCLAPQAEQEALDWLDAGAPWRLKETDFYEQFEFSLFDAALPPALASLVSSEGLAATRGFIERSLDCRLTERVDVVAHKLVEGQRIGIHNDYLSGQETHRLTIQINRGLSDEDGGFFMMFNSFDAGDVHRIIRPVSNTGVGFAIGPESHHAVSRVHGGNRYTLVYSFHARRDR